MNRFSSWASAVALVAAPLNLMAQGPTLAPQPTVEQPATVLQSADQLPPAIPQVMNDVPKSAPHPYMPQNSVQQIQTQAVNQLPVQSSQNMTPYSVEIPNTNEPAAHLWHNPVIAGPADLEIHQGYHLPGGYAGQTGSPNFYSAPGAPNNGFAPGLVVGPAGGNASGDPLGYHFGPGFYRSGEQGHIRFPYYSYRRPWYSPGFPGYNRDTNLPW